MDCSINFTDGDYNVLVYSTSEKVEKTMNKKKGFIVGLFAIGVIILIYPNAAQFINNQIQQSYAEDFHAEAETTPTTTKRKKLKMHVNAIQRFFAMTKDSVTRSRKDIIHMKILIAVRC